MFNTYIHKIQPFHLLQQKQWLKPQIQTSILMQYTYSIKPEDIFAYVLKKASIRSNSLLAALMAEKIKIKIVTTTDSLEC